MNGLETLYAAYRKSDPRGNLRVPDVYLSSALLANLAIQATREISNLRLINPLLWFDSRRLHHISFRNVLRFT